METITDSALFKIAHEIFEPIPAKLSPGAWKQFDEITKKEHLNRITMELNQYHEKAMTTCMPSSENFSYMFLNLVGEVGEFASKVAKAIRKGNAEISHSKLSRIGDTDMLATQDEELKKEAGDILWQLSGVCSVMGWSLNEVAQMNLDKLAARKAVGTIDGNGDGIIRGK